MKTNKKKVVRFKISRKEQLSLAYDDALYAINSMSDVSAHLEEFDQQMEGSSITDELNEIVYKAQEKMQKCLDKNFKILGFEIPSPHLYN